MEERIGCRTAFAEIALRWSHGDIVRVVLLTPHGQAGFVPRAIRVEEAPGAQPEIAIEGDGTDGVSFAAPAAIDVRRLHDGSGDTVYQFLLDTAEHVLVVFRPVRSGRRRPGTHLRAVRRPEPDARS